ncbi:MAG TPA: chemotaxis protein CheD [Casimicrobiaceae bacterium]|jgi:chemotaxis protein CheD|nr:chemotaxis protein CheD [Casimicrobiaceae bacterium]
MIDADQTTEIRVKVAECAVGREEQTLITIGLGSCVAIALYDSVARVGGLAHTLLPDESMARDRTNPAKFPSSAVTLLLAEMTRLGADPTRVRAKLVGGASMFANLLPSGGINIGDRNVAAARQALERNKIRIVAEDVGSDHGRSVHFHLDDGRVEVRSLKKGNRVL